MELINAQQDHHRHLYHFQSFNACTADRLERTLRDGTIHMSRPSAFNDPWDFKPWFDVSILADPIERELHLQWLIRTSNVQPEHEAELRANPVLFDATIALIRDGLTQQLDDQYRVYCLSPDPLNTLMWAHYGDSHRGVALEFNTRANQVVWAYRVHYRETYPTIRMYEDADNANLVPVFTKSDVWAYEAEYRLLADETSTNPNMPRTVESNLRLARGALVGLVVGCQCDADHVLDLAARHAPTLRVRRANRQMDRYALTLETLR